MTSLYVRLSELQKHNTRIFIEETMEEMDEIH